MVRKQQLATKKSTIRFLIKVCDFSKTIISQSDRLIIELYLPRSVHSSSFMAANSVAACPERSQRIALLYVQIIHEQKNNTKSFFNHTVQILHKMILPDEQIIDQTKRWITDVVIACNFCPFAAKEMKQKTVHYQVEKSLQIKVCLQKFTEECVRLDNNIEIETTLIIYPVMFKKFVLYLDFVSLAEKALKKNGYKGKYQVATFHPDYYFAGSLANDAANYTNRSLYPMLHLLREERIEQALLRYPNPEQIPERNIDFAREKGTVYMKMLRDSCL